MDSCRPAADGPPPLVTWILPATGLRKVEVPDSLAILLLAVPNNTCLASLSTSKELLNPVKACEGIKLRDFSVNNVIVYCI
tara:strand:- start:156 stop:398 length:243 start_codon:yes stop_codon:yes gene_type:complete